MRRSLQYTLLSASIMVRTQKIPLSKKVELFLLLACDHKNPYADILFNADFVTYQKTKDKPFPE